MKDRISVLASDDFLGRAPSTEGEVKTISYLAERFKQFGLKPANKGSFFQEVPLVKLTADASMKLDISGGKSNISLKFSDDFIGGTPQVSELVKINNSDIVFVGYGINSPENGWNDYAGLDVKGKTVLMLVNDPGYATSDTNLFNGKTMTIYGRWTYKYDEAASLDYNKIISSAAKRGFKPVNMNLKASIQFKNKVEYTKSNNVAAVWPGTDQSDEYIIYTAHWDHFGVNPAFKGNSILNGALDNAIGTAALIEIAKAFTKLPEKQNRSILFLAVTCEEQGLIVEHGKEWALAESEKWIMDNYHKPSDNYEPDKWKFDGMIEDIKVYFEIAYNLIIIREFPNWNAGSPFKSFRDQMMK